MWHWLFSWLIVGAGIVCVNLAGDLEVLPLRQERYLSLDREPNWQYEEIIINNLSNRFNWIEEKCTLNSGLHLPHLGEELHGCS